MGLKLPWREAGPPSHLDDEVDSDHQVVNKETLSMDALQECAVS